MTDDATRPVLRLSRRFDAPAERVFDAWQDPQIARRWLFTTPESRIVGVRIDARVGGGFALVDRRGEEEIEHVGEYLEIVRPHRLVFTFGVPAYSADFDRVAIDIRPLGSGCELTLTHEMTPAGHAEWGEASREGWTRLLAALAATLDSPTPPTGAHR